jgi:hypothetical protein
MTIRNTKRIKFTSVKGKKLEAEFSGSAVTSDGGILLLGQADRKMRLLEEVARSISDVRDPCRIEHSMLTMLRQRVYGIALGNEDLNDHDFLRNDPAWQAAIGQDVSLASSPTLCRFENSVDRQAALEIHRVLVDRFIKSFKKAPKELVLDVDATDNPIYGEQVGKFFHGYYRSYCFLPLYVTCGDSVLVSYLRRSSRDAARHSATVLSLLVKELRRAWPKVEITIRGDSGFCRRILMHWCECNNVKYILGLAKNKRLLAEISSSMAAAEIQYEASEDKQRLFSSFDYAAESWKRKRRVVAKAEHGDQGANPRFIVTNLDGDPEALYDEVYCARGEMENRIKEQIEMFSDRTSCHNWWPNQLRLLLSTLAYTLVNRIRTVGLVGTELARAQVGTIRLKLLKVGAVVIRNTRRIRFLLSSTFPYQHLFETVAARLQAT